MRDWLSPDTTVGRDHDYFRIRRGATERAEDVVEIVAQLLLETALSDAGRVEVALV